MSKFKHAFKHQAWVQQKCEQEEVWENTNGKKLSYFGTKREDFYWAKRKAQQKPLQNQFEERLNLKVKPNTPTLTSKQIKRAQANFIAKPRNK